jgi:hypothetical protein
MPQQFLDFEQAAAFCSELAGEAVAQVVPPPPSILHSSQTFVMWLFLYLESALA